MRDGDLYRWCYQQHVIDKSKDSVNAGTLYWCCSNIAQFRNGRLRDTFWTSGSDGRSWTEEEAQSKLEITFLANEEDLEETRMSEYYDKKDVVNIRHSNSSQNNIFIRKGSKRSISVMKELIKYKISDAEYRVDSAKRDVERMKQTLLEIDTTEDLEKFYI